MGGYGSGSHESRPPRKAVVEDCRGIDASLWVRKGILKAGVHQMAVCTWKYRGGAESSIGIDVMTQDMGQPSVVLFYTHTTGEEPRQEQYKVRLTTTVPRFGGIRWWFLCPMISEEFPCDRRVGKLYLPPGRHYFGCRHCHRLSYTSCQESRKYQALYRHIAANLGEDMGEVKRIMRCLDKRRQLP
jgi:hypothetical protein